MVRASRHRRDLTMSVLLLTIVVVFIVCNIARVACNMYEAYQMLKFGRIKFWPEWIDVLSRLNHVLLSINSSINIVIYTAKVSVNYSFLKLPSKGDHITNNPCYYLPHTTFKLQRCRQTCTVWDNVIYILCILSAYFI